jgi:hypothetical protein
MTDLQEKAMRMALEALKKSHPISNSNEDLYAHSEAGSELYNELKKAKALAQPEQEPVAWVDAKPDGYDFYGLREVPFGKHYLYTAPYTKTDNPDRVLHKEWVGLTDEQIYQHEWWDEETAFAVNKELKEKNT